MRMGYAPLLVVITLSGVHYWIGMQIAGAL